MLQTKGADPAKLREEFKKHLSKEEVEQLGVNLGAGASHYRAFVGPPFNYDINSALQFQFLTDLGMREYHRFLEIGCGSLRLGRLAIVFLLPGRYFGVEPNQDMLRRGVIGNLGAPPEANPLFQLKKPRFAHNSVFDFSFTGGPVDYVFAQSIASHTGMKETRELLTGISRVCHNHTIAMVTYIRCQAEVKSNKEDGWFYPKCVTYSDKSIGAMASDVGLKAYKTAWPLTNIREDGLITGQQPLILTRSAWRPGPAQRFASALFSGVEPIN